MHLLRVGTNWTEKFERKIAMPLKIYCTYANWHLYLRRLHNSQRPREKKFSCRHKFNRLHWRVVIMQNIWIDRLSLKQNGNGGYVYRLYRNLWRKLALLSIFARENAKSSSFIIYTHVHTISIFYGIRKLTQSLT